LFEAMQTLHLYNTLQGLVLLYTGFVTPFSTWMLYGYFKSIPKDVEEAALIDGCSVLGTLRHVVLPLAIPGLGATAVLAMLAAWNEFIFATLFLQDHNLWPITIGIANFQGEYYTAWGSMAAVEIVAGCDLDSKRLDAISRDAGVPRTYRDYRDLLRREEVDLVSVCTMPVTHSEVVVASLAAGAHVLCEKPLAMNAAEAQTMIAAAVKAGRMLTVGFNMRFMGSAQFAKQIVSGGQLGPPQYARVYALANDIPWWGKHYVRAISGGGVLASLVASR
jgi:predicted dehydrogenase